MKADVVIAGAGVSGVPAAVAAARAGARTLLVEKMDRVGGTMASSLGFPVCGLFTNAASASPTLLNSGLCEELFVAVSAEIPDPVSVMGRVQVCRCPVSLFQSIFNRWLREENLTVCLGVKDLSVICRPGHIEGISFQTLEGERKTVVTGQVIDCTGDGEIIQKSGAEQIVPGSLPLAGFSVRLRNVKEDDLLPVKVPYVLRKAVDEGELPDCCAFTGFSPMEDGQALCKFSLPEATGPSEAGDAVRKALRLLKEKIPALAESKPSAFSPSVLHREGMRLLGEYVLSEEDVCSGRKFADCAAHGGWPIEYWDSERGVQYEYIQGDGSYDIPVRCLRSVNIRNLWTAGRLISADSRALASARVMGTSIATGEAAGRAAAKETA
jgi:hypothetical protein